VLNVIRRTDTTTSVCGICLDGAVRGGEITDDDVLHDQSVVESFFLLSNIYIYIHFLARILRAFYASFGFRSSVRRVACLVNAYVVAVLVVFHIRKIKTPPRGNIIIYNVSNDIVKPTNGRFRCVFFFLQTRRTKKPVAEEAPPRHPCWATPGRWSSHRPESW